jgi:hypothetical protein
VRAIRIAEVYASVKRGQIKWLRLRVRKCVRMRTQENPQKSKSGEVGRSGEISRNVRKLRGLGFERLGFLWFLLVGTPGFEPGGNPRFP